MATIPLKFTRSHLIEFLVDCKGYELYEMKKLNRDELCDLITNAETLEKFSDNRINKAILQS